MPLFGPGGKSLDDTKTNVTIGAIVLAGRDVYADGRDIKVTLFKYKHIRWEEL